LNNVCGAAAGFNPIDSRCNTCKNESQGKTFRPCFRSLPDEILVQIFEFLDPKSLSALARTSRKLSVLVDDNGLWRSLVLQHQDAAFSAWSKPRRKNDSVSAPDKDTQLKMGSFDHAAAEVVALMRAVVRRDSGVSRSVPDPSTGDYIRGIYVSMFYFMDFNLKFISILLFRCN
jgi:hypothetical protein